MDFLLKEDQYEKSEELNADFYNMVLTENGDKAYASTLNALVDLYYKSLRNVESDELRLLFEKAWDENPYLTLRCIAHIRDIRG